MTLKKSKVIFVNNSTVKFIVDIEDFERCSRIKWSVDKQNYAQGSFYGEKVFLHRFIYWLFPGDKNQVDHKNGNVFDCRKTNLRLSTQSQNRGNSKKAKNKSSKYKGVYFNGSRWTVQIKHTHIGNFRNEEEAAKAYNIAALQIFGEFARLNKIEDTKTIKSFCSR